MAQSDLNPPGVENDSASDAEPCCRILLENLQVSDIASQHDDGLVACLLHDLSIGYPVLGCLCDAPCSKTVPGNGPGIHSSPSCCSFDDQPDRIGM
jgi:hypothetical protein